MAGNGSRAGSGRGSGAGSGGMKAVGVGNQQRIAQLRRSVNQRVTDAVLQAPPKVDRRTQSGRQTLAAFNARKDRIVAGSRAVTGKNNPMPDNRGSGNRAGRRALERRAGASGLRFGTRINQRRNESGLGGPGSLRRIPGRRAGTVAR